MKKEDYLEEVYMKKVINICKRVEDFFLKQNYEKIYCRILAIVFLLIMLPLFWASFHNTIFMDDCYGHALDVHLAWKNNPNIYGLFCAIGAAFKRMISIYLNWGGNYTSFFFSAFQPMAFSEKLNFVGTFIFLGCFLIAEYRLLKEVLSNCFGMTKRTFLISYFVVTIMATQWLTSIEEGFFWYSACVTNALGFAASLEFLRILVKVVRTRNINAKAFVWGSILAIFIGGCNYSSMMSLFVILFFFLLYFVCRKDISKEDKIKVVVMCLVVYIGGMISIIAPGNMVRRQINEGMSAVNAIFSAIICGKNTMIQYTDYKMLLYSILMFPFAWNSLNEKKGYKCPLVLVLFSIGIFCAAFTPTMLSDSDWGPRRTRNLYWWMYLNLYTINYIYILGWCKHSLATYFDGKAISFGRKSHAYFFFILIVFSLCLTKVEDIKKMPSVITYLEIRNGRYKDYDKQIAERREILYSDERDVVIKHIDYLPYVIFTTDTLSFNEIGTVSSSEYYDKDSITVVE